MDRPSELWVREPNFHDALGEAPNAARTSGAAANTSRKRNIVVPVRLIRPRARDPKLFSSSHTCDCKWSETYENLKK